MNLIEAVKAGDIDLVKSLLDQGADVNQKNKKIEADIMSFIEQGQEKVLLSISKINPINFEGSTALIIAAANGCGQLVELLLKKGANIDHVNALDMTALMYAAGNGHAKVVQFLLDNGAHLDHMSNKFYTWRNVDAFKLALSGGHVEAIKILFRKDISVFDMIMMALPSKNIEAVKFLLNQDTININEVHHSGTTLLVKAAFLGYKEIVELLLDKGADINQPDKNGDVALIASCVSFCESDCQTQVVELLLNKGSNIDSVNRVECTALMYAAELIDRDKIVDLLLDRGASTDLRNLSGQKALELAFLRDRYKVIKKFILVGAFTINDMPQIKEHIDKILAVSTPLEKAISLRNLVTVTNGKDTEFIKGLLNAEIPKIEAYITAKSFRKLEQMKMYEIVQSLKEQVKALGIISDALSSSLNDDGLSLALKDSYDKISEVWGRCLSKEKLTKDSAQKIASFFKNDDDLESVCEAVPYKYAINILKPTPQKCPTIQIQADEGLAVVLGAEKAVEELSV